MKTIEIMRNNAEEESIYITAATNDINNKVYSTLTNGEYDNDIDIETAIDIACWCELASVGEEYETDNLTIIVKE